MKNKMHFDPYDEGFRSACRVEMHGRTHRERVTMTSDLDRVTCRTCEATPEFEAARMTADRARKK